MSLKIAQIGNFRHDWCTEVHLARDLEGLGHTVHKFQEPLAQGMERRFLREVQTWCRTNKPDLLMFTRTRGLPNATELWREVEARGTKTCSYHLDLYVGLQREEGIEGDPFWTTQYVFTPDGDPGSAEFFAAHGINHIWSPPAVVSDECVPGKWDDRFDFDVVFVGSEGYHPEWPWRPQLIDFLRHTYGDRFRRFGGDCPGGPTRGLALNDLYATARVVVGDSLCLPGHTNYFTDRYFETIGRGGFLVAPWVPGIEDFLTPGDPDSNDGHFDWYLHPDDPRGPRTVTEALSSLRSTIDYWLRQPERARLFAANGQAHVRANHTYRHRLEAALQAMGFPPSPNAPHLKASKPVTAKKPAAKKAPGKKAAPKPVAVGALAANMANAVIEKLELGSGYHPTPGFTHLDLNAECPDVDIVGPAWPLNLPDASVGELRAVDVLEHLSYWDTDAILADWFRVLRPGGKLYVQVPDADLIMQWYCNDPSLLVARVPVDLPQTPLAGAAWRLLGGHNDGVYVKGGQDFRLNAHYALFSSVSLRLALTKAGFEIEAMQINSHPNILCWAVKL